MTVDDLPELERQFQRRVVGAAIRVGWEVKHTVNSRRSRGGQLDCDFAHAEHGCFKVEMKTPTGRLSVAQARLHMMEILAGREAYVWMPGMEDLIEQRLHLLPGTLTGKVVQPATGNAQTQPARTSSPVAVPAAVAEHGAVAQQRIRDALSKGR